MSPVQLSFFAFIVEPPRPLSHTQTHTHTHSLLIIFRRLENNVTCFAQKILL